MICAAPPALGNLIGYFFGSLFVLMIIDDNRGAGLRQTNGRGGADTAARAGYERDFTRQGAII